MISAVLSPATPGQPADVAALGSTGSTADAGSESTPGGFARALDAAQAGQNGRAAATADDRAHAETRHGRQAANGGAPRAGAAAPAPDARPAAAGKIVAGRAAPGGTAAVAAGRSGAPAAADGVIPAAEAQATGTAEDFVERVRTGPDAPSAAADPAEVLAELRARVASEGETRAQTATLAGTDGIPPAGAPQPAGRSPAGDGRPARTAPAMVGIGPAGGAALVAAETDARALLQALADAQAGSAGDAAAVRADATNTTLAPPLAGMLPAASSGGSAVPPAEARLAAPPGSADFSNQLGAQLTTFVREGVQHARLHLHPTELGPVTVRIQIDGQAAQVHMAAEHALTRQALEQSMPLLAGNLREAGLTLSGGGVFEQPRHGDGGDAPGQRGGGSGSGSTPGGERGPEAPLRTTTGVPARRGVVDLVA